MTNNKKNTINIKKHSMTVFFATLFIIYSLSGYTANTHIYIVLYLCILWLIIAFFSEQTILVSIIREKKIVSLCVFLLFFIATALYSAGLYNAMKFTGSFLIAFTPMVILSYYLKLKHLKILKRLIYITLGAWTFFSIKALLFYSEYERAARSLAAHKLDLGEDIAIGGGYIFAYGSAILAVFLFDLLINNSLNNKNIKLLSWIGIILLVSVVIETLSTTTIIVMFVGLALSVIYRTIDFVHHKRLNVKGYSLKQMLNFVLLFVMLCVALLNIGNIGSSIIEISSNKDSIVWTRIGEIGGFLKYGKEIENTSFTNRLERIGDTAKLFFQSPIIGHGYKYGYDFFAFKHTLGLGNHSEWSDALGKYGLIGGIPFLLIYYFAVKQERKYGNKSSSPAWIITFVLLGSFNPFIGFQSHLVVFFLVPGISILISKQRTKSITRSE